MQHSIDHNIVIRVTQSEMSEFQDHVAIEAPLEIRLKKEGQSPSESVGLSVTMRTPGHDDELALGFLYSEGVIRSKYEVVAIEVIDENRLLLSLNKNTDWDTSLLQRNFYMSSSCGVCGKASIEAVHQNLPAALPDSLKLERNLFFRLQNRVSEKQKVFTATGGIHAAAAFDERANLLSIREDVGRHNAMDKLIGHLISNALSSPILFLSGRASFELIQKAAMMGFKFVTAVGAPSSLAIELALESDITLIGFLRPDHFNIYSCPHRVL